MDSFTKTGWWWIPSRVEDEIHGELTFNPQDGLEFTGHGTFGSGTWDVTTVVPVIHGRADTTRISLHHCQVTSTTGSDEFTARPTRALLGIYLDSPGDCAFSTVAVEFSDLLEWSGLRGFTTQTMKDHDNRPRYQLTQEHDEIGPCSTPYGEISITASASFRITRIEAAFTAKPHVLIKGNESRDFETWMKLCIRPINEFLDLGANCAVGIDSITALIPDPDSRDEEERELPIDIIFNPIYHDDRKVFRHFLFTHRDIEENWCAILERWLAVHHELKPVMDFFFSNWYRPMYAENRFIDTVFALEAYHRLRYRNYVDHPEAHELRLASILEAVGKESPDNLEWLTEKLEYTNEPRLRQRLKDIMKTVDPVTKALLRNSKSRDAFVRLVVDTRNSLAHPEGNPKGGAVRGGTNYVWNTERLSWLLKACFLREAGIELDSVLNLITRHPYFIHLARLPLRQ